MDTAWLAQEAKTLHHIFANYFYLFVGTLLMLGVVLDYFKFTLGQTPQFGTLVGRAILAGILLVAVPEIMNALASVADSLSNELGDLNKAKYILSRVGETYHKLSFSWVSIKQSIVMIISMLTFFLLYVVVYLFDAMFLYTWTLLYVFSPILVAFFVLPSTAGATKGLFKSMIEVACWKIVWTVLVTLLWSMSTLNFEKQGNINFLTIILLNLMLVCSVVMVPKITSSLINGGLAQVASSFSDLMKMIPGANVPSEMIDKATGTRKQTERAAWNGAKSLFRSRRADSQDDEGHPDYVGDSINEE